MGPVAIDGAATDNLGVAQVFIAIRNKVTRLWLQPRGSWGSTYQNLPTSVSSPGATATGWSYAWTPQASGTYVVVLKARDGAGNLDPSPAGSAFKVGSDRIAAKARLVTRIPYNNPVARRRGGVTLRGSVSDDQSVGAVMIAIKSRQTGRWWHPHKHWGRQHYFRAELGVPGARSSNWRFHVWLPRGRYRLQLASIDASGNLRIRWIKIRVRHHA